MEFQTIINRALEIRKHYEAKEKQLYGSAWTSEEIALAVPDHHSFLDQLYHPGRALAHHPRL